MNLANISLLIFSAGTTYAGAETVDAVETVVVVVVVVVTVDLEEIINISLFNYHKAGSGIRNKIVRIRRVFAFVTKDFRSAILTSV